MHSAPEAIREVLTGTNTWAVVGCSPDPGRDSHRIARLLQQRGYRVIPVNPRAQEILGELCYASVGEIPPGEGVEVVDIFRRSDRAGVHVDEAIAAGARAVWLQLGVIDEAAAQRALDAGLLVVMDRCPAIELPRLGPQCACSARAAARPGGDGAAAAASSPKPRGQAPAPVVRGAKQPHQYTVTGVPTAANA
jgi:predicted CoA-binding protein